MKLLLVEDEIMLSKIVAKGLKKCGYAVDTACDGQEAIELYEINEYDLIILDLNLPKIDGIEVLKEIRQKNIDIKILILSARSEIDDRIIGLDTGANDYLVKPFDFNELEARIRCLLRRSFVQNNVIITCKNLSVDMAKKCAFTDNITIDLTKKEYSILEYLILNKDKVISSEQLIEHIWDSDVDLFSNSLKFHIHSLKKKLFSVIKNPELIKNIRGQGYIMDSGELDAK